MKIKYAHVIIDNKSLATNRLYTYKINKDLLDNIQVGMRVIIPFGKGNKNIKALVVNIFDEFKGNYKLKEIIDILDDRPIISKDMIELSKWISKTYLSSYLDALNLVLPPGNFKEIETYVSLLKKPGDFLDKDINKILSYLSTKEKIKLSELKKELKIKNINELLKSLKDQDFIDISIEVETSIKRKKEKRIKIKENLKFENAIKKINKIAVKQIEVLKYIYEIKDISFKALLKNLNVSNGPVDELEKKGLIDTYYKEIDRMNINEDIKTYAKHKLNKEQQIAFNRILESHKSKFGEKKHLLMGITGSGKTEIYLQLVEEMIKEGKDSIILVPEISLTPQTIERFVGRFKDDVAVLHSKLSYGERFDQWRKIKEGKVKIAVGARSGIFAPFNNLGLIIIDEEHEDSYKSSQNPKYDTIKVAEKRIEMEGGSLVLGTATPSIDSYYQSKLGNYKLSVLETRANNSKLPEIELVDMREELNEGNRSIFSNSLYYAIAENLRNKKQTILFLNRRGFSSFVSCRSCGYVIKCSDCEVSMTYHKNLSRLKCHYCGKTEIYPKVCPNCSSSYIKDFGIGTQQVEYISKQVFPKANIVRVDTDTMNRKGSYDKMFKEMNNGKIDILIGTQMISKGLDFKNVNLVGIIAADTSLNLPDYKSSEKTFQLITQVAGRTGRGEEDGRVILQTYNPDHYSIQSAKSYSYEDFYNTEIKLRKEFNYPPFINIVSILVYGKENSEVMKVSYQIGELIKTRYKGVIDYNEDFILGPYPAPLEKIKRNFRWQILIKATDVSFLNVKDIIEDIILQNKFNLSLNKVKISIDVNPNSIL